MSKNMKWTLGLLVVGCMLAMAAPAGAAMMDSADFTWKYEMVNTPDMEDLDINTVMDFSAMSGVAGTTDGDILTVNVGGVAYYDNDAADQTWDLDPNITYDNGYTFEIRLKVGGTFSRGIVVLAAPDANSPGAWLNIAHNGQTWDAGAGTPLGSAVNNDDFHVFRVAQAPGATTYSVWRDGVLLSDTLGQGYGPEANSKIAFGGVGDTWGGVMEIDYLRFTSGAYAPIPEPGTLVLLAGALLSLLVWRRR